VILPLLLLPFLVSAADKKRPLNPQTRAQLETILGYLEAALARVGDVQAKDSLHSSLAKLYGQLGELGLARQNLETMGQPTSRDFALGSLACSQAEAGDFLQARMTAAEIGTQYERGRALGCVARKQVQAGRLNEALATAAEIDDPQARSDTLLLLGLALARQKQQIDSENVLAQAAEAARQMEYPGDQAWQLLNVAEAQKRAGQEINMQHTLGWARRAIDQVQVQDTKDRLLGRLAALQTKLGLEGEAYVTEGDIEDSQHRWEPRAAHAAKQAQRGDSAGVLSLIDNADPPVSQEEENARAWALEKVAQAQANAGDYLTAREVINRIPANHPARAHTLANLAQLLWWRGNDQEADSAFEEALDTASRVEDPGMRAQALRIVAGNLGETNQAERALGVLQRIDRENERRNALSSIALSRGRRGETEAALDWILRVEEPVEQAQALLGLAHGLILFDQHGPPRPRPQPASRPN